MTASRRKPLVPCSVVVKQPGMTSHYEGLFPSTCDAVIDAMDRFPNARGISVSRHTDPLQPQEVSQ
jgi:hypothetical protein